MMTLRIGVGILLGTLVVAIPAGATERGADLSCAARVGRHESNRLACFASCERRAEARAAEGESFDTGRCETRCEERFDGALSRLVSRYSCHVALDPQLIGIGYTTPCSSHVGINYCYCMCERAYTSCMVSSTSAATCLSRRKTCRAGCASKYPSGSVSR